MSAEVGDYATFWRRDPGGKSEIIQVEVLETIEEANWAYVRRVDTNEERPIQLSRLHVVKLSPLKR